MPHTRVKICGITSPEDATKAAELGADFIGLNFYKGPRRIGESQAIHVLHGLETEFPKGLRFVALVDGPSELFRRVSELIEPLFQISVFQLYGDYSELPAASYFAGRERWGVVHVASPQTLVTLKDTVGTYRFEPNAILLDTASKSHLGGTGQTFNWHWIAEARAAGELDGLPPLILAGGLTPDNVAHAIQIAKPYAVDVSSGVEIPGKPGIKDPLKMRDFIQAAKSAEFTL